MVSVKKKYNWVTSLCPLGNLSAAWSSSPSPFPLHTESLSFTAANASVPAWLIHLSQRTTQPRNRHSWLTSLLSWGQSTLIWILLLFKFPKLCRPESEKLPRMWLGLSIPRIVELCLMPAVRPVWIAWQELPANSASSQFPRQLLWLLVVIGFEGCPQGVCKPSLSSLPSWQWLESPTKNTLSWHSQEAFLPQTLLEV